MTTASFTRRHILVTLGAVAALLGILTAGGISAAAGSAAASNASADVESSASWQRCKGTTRAKGRRYAVLRRSIGCRKAKKLTRRVVRKKQSLRGWKCSLSLAQRGRCEKGGRGFLFVRQRR